MKFLETSVLSSDQEALIHHLWNKEYPAVIQHNSLNDTQNYLNALINPFHVFLVEDEIKAWYCDFDRDGQRFFVMIVGESAQRKNVGSAFLQKAKKRNSSLHGWIVLTNEYLLASGKKYTSLAQFYLKNDFQIIPEIQSSKHRLNTVLIAWYS